MYIVHRCHTEMTEKRVRQYSLLRVVAVRCRELCRFYAAVAATRPSIQRRQDRMFVEEMRWATSNGHVRFPKHASISITHRLLELLDNSTRPGPSVTNWSSTNVEVETQVKCDRSGGAAFGELHAVCEASSCFPLSTMHDSPTILSPPTESACFVRSS